MDRSDLSPQDQADGLDTCACGAEWSGDDLSHCPVCGRDLDIEITISHCEYLDAISEGFTKMGLIARDERAMWSRAHGWLLGPVGEECAATAFVSGWLDALNAHMCLWADGEPDESGMF